MSEDLHLKAYKSVAEVLAAYLELLKKKNPRFTLNAWAKKLGEKNSGNLVHYMKCRRAPTIAMTEKLIESMRLSVEDANYFRDLVDRTRVEISAATRAATAALKATENVPT